MYSSDAPLLWLLHFLRFLPMSVGGLTDLDADTDCRRLIRAGAVEDREMEYARPWRPPRTKPGTSCDISG